MLLVIGFNARSKVWTLLHSPEYARSVVLALRSGFGLKSKAAPVEPDQTTAQIRSFWLPKPDLAWVTDQLQASPFMIISSGSLGQDEPTARVRFAEMAWGEGRRLCLSFESRETSAGYLVPTTCVFEPFKARLHRPSVWDRLIAESNELSNEHEPPSSR